MATTPEELYQTVRPILQGDRDVEGWKLLLKTLDDPAADTPHFRQEFEPAILTSLDRDWQDGVRVVTHEDPARVRRYARIYSVITTYRHSGTFFKKSVKELAADIKKGVVKGHYSGLYMYRVTGLPNLMFEELVASGKVGALTHFHVEEIGQYMTYKRYNGPADQLGAMIHAVIDRDAATLRSFGGSLWASDSGGVLDPLFGRRAELTELESITLKFDDAIANLDALADFELRELSVTGYFSLDQLDALFEHRATDHLERFKCHWHEGELDFPRWVGKGLAPSVEEWCVMNSYDYQHESLYFDTARAMYWREHLQGKERHLLDARVVCLPSVDAEATRVHLFDGDTLKPSAELEALSVGSLEDEDAIELLTQARSAWPNLKTLFLPNAFSYGTEQWEFLNECDLLEHLDYFDWGSIIAFNYTQVCGDLKRAKERVTTYRAAVTPYVDEITGGTLRPILAARLAFDVIQNTSTLPTIKALATLFDMPVEPGEGTYEISHRLKAHVVDLINPNGLQPSPFIQQSPDYDGLRRHGPMNLMW